jgi:hypothetical protein
VTSAIEFGSMDSCETARIALLTERDRIATARVGTQTQVGGAIVTEFPAPAPQLSALCVAR